VGLAAISVLTVFGVLAHALSKKRLAKTILAIWAINFFIIFLLWVRVGFLLTGRTGKYQQKTLRLKEGLENCFA
jgi:hypothetical protein